LVPVLYLSVSNTPLQNNDLASPKEYSHELFRYKLKKKNPMSLQFLTTVGHRVKVFSLFCLQKYIFRRKSQ
jgi:hypothetical protein